MWAGIVGRSVAGKIDNCSFNGNIKGKAYVGGIVGFGRRVNVSNCSNFGYVKCDVGRVGGIFGDAGYTVSIYNCFNAGHIYSDTSTAGSMAAHIDWGGIVSNNYNVGDIEGKDIYAISNHPGTTESKNNFFLEGAGKKGNFSSIIEKTKEYMQSQEFVNELNKYIDENPIEGIILLKWKYNEGNYPTFE
ncbi:MAG: hypothetical protein ACLRQZ_04920 [Clostridia bacterium]